MIFVSYHHHQYYYYYYYQQSRRGPAPSRLPASQRNRRGDVDRHTTGADAQTHMGALSENQSLILYFNFSLLLFFWLCSSSVLFFYLVVSLFLFLSSCFPFYIFPDLIFLFYILIFSSTSFLFLCLLFFSYLIYTSKYKDSFARKGCFTSVSYIFSENKIFA